MTTAAESSAADAKRFIDAAELHRLSEDLAEKVALSGFRPTFIVGAWRGGSYPAMVLQETLEFLQGTKIDHVAVRTSSRDPVTGLPLPEIMVHASDYACSVLQPEDKLLFVDDVSDSGRSGAALFKHFQNRLGQRMPRDARLAVLIYKPLRNTTTIVPDYFVEESDAWVVFSHELAELSNAEIEEHRPRVWQMKQRALRDTLRRKLKEAQANVFD